MKAESHYSFKVMTLIALSLIIHPQSTLLAQGTAFTYQGRLTQSGTPYNGNVELQFTLWNTMTNGVLLAAATPATTIVTVSNGLFAAAVDFGWKLTCGRPSDRSRPSGLASS